MNEDSHAGTLDGRAVELRPPVRRPAAVYVIAIFFTCTWLFTLLSLLYVVYHFTPEMRHRLFTTPPVVSVALAELNALLTMVGALLLLAMRRLGAGLLLASTALLVLLCALSWPSVLAAYMRHPDAGMLRSIALGASNLLLHIAASLYAFRLDRQGLLR